MRRHDAPSLAKLSPMIPRWSKGRDSAGAYTNSRSFSCTCSKSIFQTETGGPLAESPRNGEPERSCCIPPAPPAVKWGRVSTASHSSMPAGRDAHRTRARIGMLRVRRHVLAQASRYSGAMVREKVASACATGCDRLVSADCGCLLNIGHAAEHQAAPLAVEHLASFLWRRTQNPPT